MTWVGERLDRWTYRRGMAAADGARDAGRPAEAAVLYGRLADRFPGNPGLRILCGNMLKDSRQYAEARRCYDTALALQPDHADTHLQLGHLAKLQGNLEEAAAAYRRAAELDPTQPGAIEELKTLEPRLASLQPGASQRLKSASAPALVAERLKVALAQRPQ